MLSRKNIKKLEANGLGFCVNTVVEYKRGVSSKSWIYDLLDQDRYISLIKDTGNSLTIGGPVFEAWPWAYVKELDRDGRTVTDVRRWEFEEEDEMIDDMILYFFPKKTWMQKLRTYLKKGKQIFNNTGN